MNIDERDLFKWLFDDEDTSDLNADDNGNKYDPKIATKQFQKIKKLVKSMPGATAQKRKEKKVVEDFDIDQIFWGGIYPGTVFDDCRIAVNHLKDRDVIESQEKVKACGVELPKKLVDDVCTHVHLYNEISKNHGSPPRNFSRQLLAGIVMNWYHRASYIHYVVNKGGQK